MKKNLGGWRSGSKGRALHSKREALSTNPITTKKKKKNLGNS
jgi:hypothetical protein